MDLVLNISITLSTDALASLLQIPGQLNNLIQQVQQVTNNLNQEIETLALDFSKLQAAVAQEASVVQSVIVLIQQIAAGIQSNAADQGTLDQFVVQLQEQATTLAAAVANTPAPGQPAPPTNPAPAPTNPEPAPTGTAAPTAPTSVTSTAPPTAPATAGQGGTPRPSQPNKL